MLQTLRSGLLILFLGLFLFLTTDSIASKMISLPQDITIPASFMNSIKSFEPSGQIYLPDLNRYLVVCDDTDKNDSPLVFLIDERGKVEAQPIRINGVREMTDMESVSQDNQGFIYFLSSQSLNKNGKNKRARNLFVKAHRQGKTIQAINQIELRPLLIKAIQNSSLPEMAAIKNRVSTDLDVESHFILNGDLYLGLKNPQPQIGSALILKVGSVQKILQQNQIANLSIWRKVDFSKASSKGYILSELLLIQNTLFLTTTTELGDGALWKLDITQNTLQLLQEFNGFRPEGLSYRPQTNDLMVVFDQGDSPAQYVLYPHIL